MAQQQPYTYSFLDVQAAISGPGGNINLGNGAATAEEGITVAPIEDKDTMRLGADGAVSHSLHAATAWRVTVRLLKTSPTNQLLQQMYNLQKSSSLNWGQNTLVVSNPVVGDIFRGTQAAFMKPAENTWAKDAGMLEWEFNVGQGEMNLGAGVVGVTSPFPS